MSPVRAVAAIAAVMIIAGCGPGPAPAPAPAPAAGGDTVAAAAQAAPADGGGLKAGEYSCVTLPSGTILVGLGFKVVGPGRYTDLDGTTSGTFTVQGQTIAFHGGHLDGESGQFSEPNVFSLQNHGIECRPFS